MTHTGIKIHCDRSTVFDRFFLTEPEFWCLLPDKVYGIIKWVIDFELCNE